MTDPLAILQSTIGDAYTIERELGGGGMSRVYLATDRSLGGPVVLKILPSELGSAAALSRFKREIALAARLQHPHIVPVLSAGDAGGVPYFTMPYVSGQELTRLNTSAGEALQQIPVALLDGKTVLYSSRGLGGTEHIAFASIDDGSTTILDVLGAHPLGMIEGHIVYTRADGTVMAPPFDPRSST